MPVTAEALRHFRHTLCRREEEACRTQEERQARAWDLVRHSARRLKKDFGATRVVLFGALPAVERLSARSDIDLAVWGLSPESHLVALAALQTPEVRVDLVRMEHCPSALRQVIQQDGIPL